MQLVEDCGVEQEVARLRPDPVEPGTEGGLGALGSKPGENVAGRVRLALERGRAERGRPAVAEGDDLLGEAIVEVRHQGAEQCSGLLRPKRELVAVELQHPTGHPEPGEGRTKGERGRHRHPHARRAPFRELDEMGKELDVQNRVDIENH